MIAGPVQIHGGGHPRWATRLDDLPGIDAVASTDALASVEGPFVLVGGEPTLRPDLPDLVGQIGARVILRTDGLPFADPGVATSLERRGLRAVRVPFPSARIDACDWLLARTGAAKTLARAIPQLGDAGVHVELEIPVCRPTLAHLVETVRVGARLGARAVLLRRVRRRGPADPGFVSLSARLGLAEPVLEAAIEQARLLGLRVAVEGFPRCVLPGSPSSLRAEGPLRKAPGLPDEGVVDPAEIRCPDCPGEGTCHWAGADYVGIFGDGELRASRTRGTVTAGFSSTPADEDGRPPPREGRAPFTRIEDVLRQLARGGLGGDPLVGVPRRPVAEEISTGFGTTHPLRCPRCAPAVKPESTREIRLRLLRWAQEGVPRLVIDGWGSLWHEDALELLRDAGRLSWKEIIIRGDGAAIDRWEEGALARLRRLGRFELRTAGTTEAEHDLHLGVPGHHTSTLRALQRLRAAGVEAVLLPPPEPRCGADAEGGAAVRVPG